MNIPDKEEKTALWMACELGDAEIVKALLSVLNIDINHESEQGYTPIQIAARKGHFSLIPIIQASESQRKSCSVA